MKTSTFATIIIIILIVLGGAWYYYSMQPAAAPATDTTTQTVADTSSTPTPATSSNDSGMVDNGVTATVDVNTAPMTTTVHLTANGFTPASVTVAKGGSVTFINDTTSNMWVASDVHPTHASYDGTTRSAHCASGYAGAKPFDQCVPGSQYSFTFAKGGSISYHNHAQASQVGKVVVQ